VHELQVTERILDIAIRHASGHDVSRIVRIRLRIGELSDLEDEWIQRYFDHLSRGTLAEREELREPKCPGCGQSDCRLVSGREYLVENIEVL
jgi:hydrogenase nickel incorporation protein HypA/HybF